jgi:hypothetical protein
MQSIASSIKVVKVKESIDEDEAKSDNDQDDSNHLLLISKNDLPVLNKVCFCCIFSDSFSKLVPSAIIRIKL